MTREGKTGWFYSDLYIIQGDLIQSVITWRFLVGQLYTGWFKLRQLYTGWFLIVRQGDSIIHVTTLVIIWSTNCVVTKYKPENTHPLWPKLLSVLSPSMMKFNENISVIVVSFLNCVVKPEPDTSTEQTDIKFIRQLAARF